MVQCLFHSDQPHSHLETEGFIAQARLFEMPTCGGRRNRRRIKGKEGRQLLIEQLHRLQRPELRAEAKVLMNSGWQLGETFYQRRYSCLPGEEALACR